MPAIVLRSRRYHRRRRIPMKPSAPRSRPTGQLNLPLLNVRGCALPHDKQTELVVALVELLIGGAGDIGRQRDGGSDNAGETHR
jgi:hypothetical protein